MQLSSKLYSILKWLGLVLLPAAATLYNVTALIWDLPFAEEISKTVLAVAAFIGALVAESTAEYYSNGK